MKHTVSVICLALLLASCSKEPETKKNCIDPNTYANICVEQAIREEEAKSSSYLDMKYGNEDKAKEVVLASPVTSGPVAATPVQSYPVHHNHSSFIFLPMLFPSMGSHQPQTFSYSRPTPMRPVQPVQPSVAARMATASAKPFTAAPKPFLPPRPAPTIVRPTVPKTSFIPPAKPNVRTIPIVPQVSKPAVPTPTAAPKPSWSPPKVSAPTSRPATSSFRSFSSGRK